MCTMQSASEEQKQDVKLPQPVKYEEIQREAYGEHQSTACFVVLWPCFAGTDRRRLRFEHQVPTGRICHRLLHAHRLHAERGNAALRLCCWLDPLARPCCSLI